MTIPCGQVVLYDRWSEARLRLDRPEPWYSALRISNNVACPVWEPGTNYGAFTPGPPNPGWTSAIYLRASCPLRPGQIVVPSSVSADTTPLSFRAYKADTYIAVTSIESSKAISAVCIGGVDKDYYGWFWTGGVCPPDLAKVRMELVDETAGLCVGDENDDPR